MKRPSDEELMDLVEFEGIDDDLDLVFEDIDLIYQLTEKEIEEMSLDQYQKFCNDRFILYGYRY